MKKIVTVLLLFIAMHSFCQTDPQANPVFNSVATGEDTIGDFRLLTPKICSKIPCSGRSVPATVVRDRMRQDGFFARKP
jgi:hypothetical protein